MMKWNKFGSSFFMNQEFNFKGNKTEIKSKGKKSLPVDTSKIIEPINLSAFTPLVLGAIPVCSGTSRMPQLAKSVMGAISVAGTIRITQDSATSQLRLSYILTLLKVVNGATAKNGSLSEDELKKLIMATMSKMLEKAGPGFSSWKQILIDLMQNATLQDFLKGVQSAICALTGDPVNANTGNFIYDKEDLHIKGTPPLSFKRYYNRIDTRTGCMGAGWRHNYEIELLIEGDRYVILWDVGSIIGLN